MFFLIGIVEGDLCVVAVLLYLVEPVDFHHLAVAGLDAAPVERLDGGRDVYLPPVLVDGNGSDVGIEVAVVLHILGDALFRGEGQFEAEVRGE